MSEKALLYMIKRMDEKLKEYMTGEEHAAFSVEVAREAFRIDCEGIKDSDFKDFCLRHFDEIVGGAE